jgi:cobalt-zinc-cadmium efflux system membrane fusion protein
VHEGDSAEVRLNAFPEHPYTGRVSNIGRILDPATRTAKVRIELANPGLVMRSGMFATATLRSKKQAERLVIPTSAVVRLRDRNWAFLSVGGNRFRKVEVQTGQQLSGSLQEVLAGLNAGDRVVSNALQFVSSSEEK